MRHLASIRKISKITPIEGADAIVLVQVDGWQCVAKKEEFKVGDLCVYFEIDSLIPLIPEVEHLRSRSYKRMGDREGIRIKTIKLRGQLSQGLALPIMNNLRIDIGYSGGIDEVVEPREGMDVTELLGVVKYEQPVPQALVGQAAGNFPSFIPKTDQERCQNIPYDIFELHKDDRYEITLKCDGSSFTGFRYNGHTGVCSRNYELKTNEYNNSNAFVRLFVDSGLQEVLAGFSRNIAVQGELMGPGIQKNREELSSTKLMVFDIYDIDCGTKLKSHDRLHLLSQLRAAGLSDAVSHAPVIESAATLADLGITDMSSLLAYADRPSIKHAIAEGVVF